MVKTNVTRLLTSAKIPFEVREYPVDENDLSGVHVADELGLPPECVFKTLVLVGERTGHFVCCIPSNFQIDLKKAAAAAGDKGAHMLPLKDLTPLTGYIRGGCSPIGMKKAFPTFIDETAQLFETICVSAGVRGAMLAIKPGDLVSYVKAQYADLT